MTNPIFYRAAIYAKRTRKETLGSPTPNLDIVIQDANRLAREIPAKVILIQKSDPYPANEGKYFLHLILK